MRWKTRISEEIMRKPRVLPLFPAGTMRKTWNLSCRVFGITVLAAGVLENPVNL